MQSDHGSRPDPDPAGIASNEQLYYHVGGTARDVPGLIRPRPIFIPGNAWDMLLLPHDATAATRERAFAQALARSLLRSPYLPRLAAVLRDAHKDSWQEAGPRALSPPPAPLRPAQRTWPLDGAGGDACQERDD